jgi:hypothetical protein
MPSIDAIESINVEQIATPTDRLLLRGRHSEGRISSNKIVYRPSFRVELAHEHVEVAPPPPLAAVAAERTLLMRAAYVGHGTTLPAVLATLFAIAIVLVGFL